MAVNRFSLILKGTLYLALSCDPVFVMASESQNVSGQKLFEAQCMACHAVEGKATIAPPIFAVKNHVVKKFPDRDAFIDRIKSWVVAPNQQDALMPGAVSKFGLMPPLAHLSSTELQAIAQYLYDTSMAMPDWYRSHYKEEHGEEPSVEILQNTE